MQSVPQLQLYYKRHNLSPLEMLGITNHHPIIVGLEVSPTMKLAPRRNKG